MGAAMGTASSDIHQVEYDTEVDALAVNFVRMTPGISVRQDELPGGRVVDYDRDGNAIAVEVLNASRGFSLVDLPRPEDVRLAAASVGISAHYSNDMVTNINRAQREVLRMEARLEATRDTRNDLIREALAAGESPSVIAREIGVSRGFIHRVIQGNGARGSEIPRV